MVSFQLTSSAFKHNTIIPKIFSCDGQDLSPPLNWTSAPEGTLSFALTCVDPDAPVGDWIHWISWDISVGSTGLSEGLNPNEQSKFMQGTNSWGRTGYSGPCPPPGHGPHRYFFSIFALDVDTLELSSKAQLKELTRAMEGHILAEAVLMGTYERK